MKSMRAKKYRLELITTLVNPRFSKTQASMLKRNQEKYHSPFL